MLRLRQMCLAAPELEPAVSDLAAIFGLKVCVRDFHVDIYGLNNALLPFGTDFVEVVAPMTDDTAVGRFLQRGEQRGAYMAIFQCDDPERRQAHVEGLGIRTPHVIDRPEYRNVQMHPKDCRATILEFARSPGGKEWDGDWWPAGPHWRQFADTRADHPRIAGLEIASPNPQGLAAHWSRIIELPVESRNGAPVLTVDGRAFTFVDGPIERISTLVVAVAAPRRALDIAAERGRAVTADRFALAGVHFRLTAHGAL